MPNIMVLESGLEIGEITWRMLSHEDSPSGSGIDVQCSIRFRFLNTTEDHVYSTSGTIRLLDENGLILADADSALSGLERLEPLAFDEINTQFDFHVGNVEAANLITTIAFGWLFVDDWLIDPLLVGHWVGDVGWLTFGPDALWSGNIDGTLSETLKGWLVKSVLDYDNVLAMAGEDRGWLFLYEVSGDTLTLTEGAIDATFTKIECSFCR